MNVSSVFIIMTGLRITSSVKLVDYKVEFMVFCLVTLHLWDHIFKNFPELRGLTYEDDDDIIGRLSQELRLTLDCKSVFKEDGKKSLSH